MTRQYTLQELEQAAESDKLDQIMVQKNMTIEEGDPVIPRKWAELKEFDRATFDIKEYQKSL